MAKPKKHYSVIGLISLAITMAAPTPIWANDTTRGNLTLASYVPPGERLQAREALRKVNALRRARGLRPVTLNPALMRASNAHARDLANSNDVSHYGSNGSTPVDRITRAGYDLVTVGENVAAGQRDLDEALDGWMGSKPHRKTIYMESARHMGVALVYDPNTTYRTFWTLVMAEPF